MPKLELMLYVLDLMYWASYFYLCNFFLEGGWENKDTWRPDKDILLKQSKEPALVLCFDNFLFILFTIKGGGVVRFYLPIKIYLPYRYWLHLHSAIIIHILVCFEDILSYIMQWNGTQYLSIFLKVILTII